MGELIAVAGGTGAPAEPVTGPAPGLAVRARDNPFAAHRLEALAYRLPAGTSWDDLLERFDHLDRRAALVGPEGRGKTTLLEQLGARLEARGSRLRRVILRRGERRLTGRGRRRPVGAVAPGDLLLVDGAQELGPWSWRRLRWAARSAGGLLVTSHRPGRLPTLLRCRSSPRLLEELVAELLGEEPGGPGAGFPDCRGLHRRHRGNLRHALQELYDRWAGLPPADR